ncbi:MAG TPA: glycosyltransferase family 4 protein [Acidimicrobiales bacterium]|nr:glycosyltransferase family 4 protein [Acidimicrobiales bacterium]
MARQSPEHLRVALLVYRGNPHSGGQGVYTRYLSRELVALGYDVTVFAGQPWPELDAGVGWIPVPSLDLYREPDPFRVPRPREFRTWVDGVEFALMCTAGFPEPLTFSLRVRKELAARRADFDVVHDNQCFGRGMLGVMADGWPLLATLHHPITVDRALDLSDAASWRRRVSLRRWYGFLRMQKRVARRVPRIVTVSESSKRDIVAQMGVAPAQLAVVPVGVDHTRFRPLPERPRVPGRIMTTASADVPMKGLVPLLEALAKVRTERPADLVVIGKPRAESRVTETIERLGLGGAVSFVSGVSDERIVELYAEASVAVVPSLYEGFSLPAVEAMACGVPLVATTGGALPEVVGKDGVTGLLVPPGDPGALASALGRVLDEPSLAARLSHAGRERVLDRFTWRACALATVEQYRWVLSRC